MRVSLGSRAPTPRSSAKNTALCFPSTAKLRSSCARGELRVVTPRHPIGLRAARSRTAVGRGGSASVFRGTFASGHSECPTRRGARSFESPARCLTDACSCGALFQRKRYVVRQRAAAAVGRAVRPLAKGAAADACFVRRHHGASIDGPSRSAMPRRRSVRQLAKHRVSRLLESC